MIDLMVNTVMLLGIVIVSVPVLVFAVTGVMHLVYSVLDKG